LTILNQQIKELQKKGAYLELIQILEEAIKREKDPEKKYLIQFRLAEAQFNARKFSIAKKQVEELVLVFQKQKKYNLLGEAENLQGKIFRIYQRYDEALNHYRNAEEAFQRCDNTEGLSKIYQNMGNVFIFLEKFKEAKKFHLKSLDLAKSINNDTLIANSYLNLGSMHYQNGEVDDALKHYENARTILEKLKDKPSLAAVYLNLAETYFLRRNYEKTSNLSAKSVLLYKGLSNIIGQTLALRTFAKSEKEQRNYNNAITSFKEIVILQEPKVNEEIYLELGACYIELKDTKSAIKSFEAILNLSDPTPQGKIFALNFLAMINGENKHFSKAVAYYERLIPILRSLSSKDEESIATTQGNLGYMLLRLGKIEESFIQLDSALKYLKKKKIWEDSIVLVSNYMSELIRTSKYIEGISFLKKYSIPLVESSKDKTLINNFIYEQALLHHITGDSSLGLSYWQNYSKKGPSQQYRPNFLNNLELEEEQKKFLEQEHEVFLQKVTSEK
jgi:tetratricopeptide (TPR) repeat protein